MAKPYRDRIGSGMHIHASILDADGRNIFDDGTAQGSERLRHAIAGLQALMPESMALFAPSINSYRRFEPDMFAPVNRRLGASTTARPACAFPSAPAMAAASSIAPPAPDANPYFRRCRGARRPALRAGAPARSRPAGRRQRLARARSGAALHARRSADAAEGRHDGLELLGEETARSTAETSAWKWNASARSSRRRIRLVSISGGSPNKIKGVMARDCGPPS